MLREHRELLAVIAAGGALGSLARWGVAEALPHTPGEVGWSTFAVNVSGAVLIGVLMTLVLGPWSRHRYLRPFLGVGVLGGYTTFSTYVLDTRGLLAAGAPLTAAAYLLGTLVAGLAGVWLGVVTGRLLIALVGHRGARGVTPAETAARED
jgi:CrcB protein